MNTTSRGPVPTPIAGRQDGETRKYAPYEQEWGGAGLSAVAPAVREFITETVLGAVANPDGPLRVGTSFGIGFDGGARYVVRELVGKGGEGYAYRLEDRAWPDDFGGYQTAVLKISLLPVGDDPQEKAQLREGFRREVAAFRSIKSRYVVQALGDFYQEFDVMAANGSVRREVLHALMMEDCAGGNLAAIAAVVRSNPLPEGQALRWIAQICEGVADVHAQQRVHGDVKPQNVLVSLNADGSVRQMNVADFGLSLTRRDLAGGRALHAGTPGYMSLERELKPGIPPSFHDDVYALGCVAYELLAGQEATDHEAHLIDYARLGKGGYRPDPRRYAIRPFPKDRRDEPDPEAWNMVLRMLGDPDAAPSRRPTAQEASEVFLGLAAAAEIRRVRINRKTFLRGTLEHPVTLSGTVHELQADQLYDQGVLRRASDGAWYVDYGGAPDASDVVKDVNGAVQGVIPPPDRR